MVNQLITTHIWPDDHAKINIGHPDRRFRTIYAESIDTTNGSSPSRLFQTATAVGNPANTTETNLHTFTVPGGTLANDGDTLSVQIRVQNANTANAKQTRVYFGATLVGDSTSLATGNNWWVIHVIIIRTSATSQKSVLSATNVVHNGSWSTAAGGGVGQFNPAETLSGDVLFRVTGQSNVAGVANDIVAEMTTIDFWPAAS